MQIKSLSLSQTLVFQDLNWLVYLPSTVSILQLDSLTMPAMQFIRNIPPLSGQIVKLALTGNPQLTKYDLVNILQHFYQLEGLDIRHSEYLTAGTVGTIL